MILGLNHQGFDGRFRSTAPVIRSRRAFFSGGIVAETTPRPVFRLFDPSALYRISVNVALPFARKSPPKDDQRP